MNKIQYNELMYKGLIICSKTCQEMRGVGIKYEVLIHFEPFFAGAAFLGFAGDAFLAAVFLAGDLLALAILAGLAAFFGDLAFVGDLTALAGESVLAFFGLLALAFLAALGFLGFFSFFFASGFALNEPLAPVPLTCLITPVSTPRLRANLRWVATTFES